MANQFKNYTYPHATSRVKDESAGTAVASITLPLHRPIFPLRAAKGKVNEINWYNGSQAIDEFGEETFNTFGKYWRNEQVFLTKAIFPNQGCFIVRLSDPEATSASLVLECHVTPDVDVQQYQRDSDGAYVYDTQGNRIPILDGANNPVTAEGVRIRHVVREMTSDEVAGAIQRKTVNAGGETTYVYPLADFKYTSPGLAGNRAGFRLFFDYLVQDEDILDETGSIIYSFACLEKPYDSDIASVVRDKFSNSTTQFVIKPDQVDSRTQRRISAKDIIQNNFADTTTSGEQVSTLPYDVNFYPTFFKEIGDYIAEVETSSELADGWMADVLSATDLKGHAYRNVELDTTGSGYVILTDATTYYLTGGTDGDLSDDLFEEMFRSLLELDLIPELEDIARYPITHIYDVGYSIETKFAMAKFMGKHEYHKPQFACQDSNEHLYSMEESISLGSAIRTRAALTPESEFHGTGACRADIFGQAGYLTDTTIKSIVPATLWMAERRATFHNATYIKGEPVGEGNHEVTIFRKHNFTPFNADQKQMCWDNAINYFQVKKVSQLFYPDLRSIYKLDSSVLSSTTFTDVIVYMKYITQEVWARYAGIRKPIANLQTRIKKDVENLGYLMCSGKYQITARVYQTAEDIQTGGIVRIETTIVGLDPFRRAIEDIVCRRENLES